MTNNIYMVQAFNTIFVIIIYSKGYVLKPVLTGKVFYLGL
jgi:hypothetical protein